MRTKATLLLLVLVVGLGGIAYYVGEKDARRRFETERTQLWDPQMAVADYLRIQLGEGDPVTLERNAGIWELTAPVHWPANEFAVTHIFSQLQFRDRKHSFTTDALERTGQTLSDYGLDPPRGVVTYGTGTDRRNLLIGSQTALDGNLYAMPEDSDTVLVVSGAINETLQLDLGLLRRGEIFSLSATEVRQWNIHIAESGNLRVWLSRDGEGWKLETPIEARANKAAVDALMNRLLNLRVASFQRDGSQDLNILGLANPAFRLTIEGTGRRESLLIGHEATADGGTDLYYAKRENNPTIFTVELDVLDDLRRAERGLRERRLVDLDPARLQSLTITPIGRPSITLQKLETGAWQVITSSPERGPVTMPGNEALINRIVDEIVNLRAVPEVGFVNEAPSAASLDRVYGLTGPDWQVRIHESGAGAEPQTLLLGKQEPPGGDHVYAKTEARPFVYLVDRALADNLSAEPLHYRSTQLRRLPEGARINAIKISRLSNDQQVFAASLSDPNQSWAAALEDETAQRRDAALALVAELRDLRAREITAAEFQGRMPNERPWTWRIEATVTSQAGVGQQTTSFALYVDAFPRGPDLLAGAPDPGLLFHARTEFIDAFETLVSTRADPGPPPPGTSRPPGAAVPAEGDEEPAAEPGVDESAPPSAEPEPDPAGD